MEPKFYLKNDPFPITKCGTVMMALLSGKSDVFKYGNVEHLCVMNGEISLLSYDTWIKINYSNGWLDLLLVLRNVSPTVMKHIKCVIKKSNGMFIKFLLVIQVLMTYSGCRDINRTLLSIFFDENYF